MNIYKKKYIYTYIYTGKYLIIIEYKLCSNEI